MEILERPDRKVSECSILAQSLADLAKDGEATSVWVSTRTQSSGPWYPTNNPHTNTNLT